MTDSIHSTVPPGVDSVPLEVPIMIMPPQHLAQLGAMTEAKANAPH